MVQENGLKLRKDNKKNRRKKRRTQDISSSSSDSDSDSDSSVNSSAEKEHNDGTTAMEQSMIANGEEDISDVELAHGEVTDKNYGMSAETKYLLRDAELTGTELTNNNGMKLGNIDLKNVASSLDLGNEKLLNISTNKNDLKNKYLGMLFEHYGDDMNKLRNAPDFTSKTLVMLANVLKDGSDMFDIDTLKAIVDN